MYTNPAPLALSLAVALSSMTALANPPQPAPATGNLFAASLGNPDFGGLGGCANQGPGIDGLPVIFDLPIAILSVDETDFEIVTSSGARVQPLCVSFIPSINFDERQTILTQADYGPAGDNPVSVEIVGTIRSADRRVNYRGQSISVVPFETGAILVYSRILPLRRLGRFDQCPVGTGQIVQLAFGSNTGTNFPASILGSFQVTLANGSVVSPFAFADTTVDNYLEICLFESSPAMIVDVAANTIMNAGGVLNTTLQRSFVQQP